MTKRIAARADFAVVGWPLPLEEPPDGGTIREPPPPPQATSKAATAKRTRAATARIGDLHPGFEKDSKPRDALPSFLWLSSPAGED